MKSSRIKHQSNFFRLENALFEYQFPFTAQIIPSLVFRDFQTNEQHKVTFLSQSCRQKIKIKYGIDKEACLDMSDKKISYWKLYNENQYYSIADVIEKKRDENVDWLVVIGGRDLEDQQLEIGDVLNVKSETRYSSFLRKSSMMRKNKRKLKVQVYPSGIELSLSQCLDIELRKCDPFSKQMYGSLSEVAFENELPCLIKFPDEEDMFTPDGTNVKGRQVLLQEQYTRRIVLACRMDRNNDLEIHSFPTHIELEIEILHGETPVASFTDDELRALRFHLIENNPNKAEECHQKRFVHDINLRMFEYEDIDESDEEDAYENAQDVSYEQVPESVSESQTDQTATMTSKDPTKHDISCKEKQFGSSKSHDDDEDDGYIKMDNIYLHRNNLSKSSMPSYIVENSTKLDQNFQFTLNPKDVKKWTLDAQTNQKDKMLYTPLEKQFEAPGYCELNEQLEFLVVNENADDEDGDEMQTEKITYYPGPAKRKDLTEKVELTVDGEYYLELPENVSDIENLSDTRQECKDKVHDICFQNKTSSIKDRGYEKIDKEDFKNTVYHDLSPSQQQQHFDEYENVCEMSYSHPPPLPMKKNNRKHPIPAKRKDLNFNENNNINDDMKQKMDVNDKELRHSYLEFIPEDDQEIFL